MTRMYNCLYIVSLDLACRIARYIVMEWLQQIRGDLPLTHLVTLPEQSVSIKKITCWFIIATSGTSNGFRIFSSHLSN